ncbi:PAS domain S-box protein [Baaleninema sp.]|uniref:PAS domain S-box protein n=1 Tax=Baaleninema sp. TaxID=3101197 RepID=UPI003D0336E3
MTDSVGGNTVTSVTMDYLPFDRSSSVVEPWRDEWGISPKTPLLEALQIWRDRTETEDLPLHLWVVEGDRLVGVVRDRDLVEATLNGCDLSQLSIAEVTQPVTKTLSIDPIHSDFTAEQPPIEPTGFPWIPVTDAEGKLIGRIRRDRLWRSEGGDSPYNSEGLLNQIAFRINRSLNLDDILDTAVREIRQLLKVDRVVVYRLEPDQAGTVIAESIADALQHQSLLGRVIADPSFVRDYLDRYRNGRMGVTADVRDGSLSPCHVELLENIGVRANLVVPLRFCPNPENREFILWGLLAAQHCQNPRPWSEDERAFLEKLASQLAVAIQHSELYQNAQNQLHDRVLAERQLRQRARQQEAIANFGQFALACTDDLSQLIDRAVRVVADILKTPYVQIWELLANQAVLLMRSGVGWPASLVGKARIGVGLRSQAGYTLDTGRPTVVSDLRVETRFGGSPLLHNCGIVSGATVPIAGVQGDFGVLGVHSPESRHFDSEDVSFLQAIANILAAAIERDRAQQDLDRFFKLSLDLFCIADTDGYFKRVNPQFEETLGYSEAELLSQQFLDFVHPDDRDRTRKIFERLICGVPCIDFENRYRCADGSYRWLAWTASPSSHEESRLYAVARDVTDRKHHEESLKQINLALANAMPGIARLDEAGIFLQVNRPYAEICGYAPDDMASLSWLQTLHPGDRPLARQALGQISTHEPRELEIRGLRRDGSRFYQQVLLVKADLDRAGFSGYYCLCKDISDRKQTEATLQQLNQRLENLVEERTAQLSDTNRQLLDEIAERKAIESEMQTRAKQQAIVAELGQLVLAHNDLTHLVDWVVLRLSEGLNVDYCKILELNTDPPDFLTLGLRSDGGRDEIVLNREPLDRDSHAIDCRQTSQDSRTVQFHRNPDGSCGLSLAVQGKHQCLGILGVYSSQFRRFSQDDLNFVQSVANILAAAIERQQTADALRHSEERFRTALKNSPIVVFNQDRNLRYTWIYNPALGYQAEEVIGLCDRDIFDPKDADILESLKYRVIDTAEGIRQEVVIREQGNLKCYDLTIEPLFDRDGTLLGVTCTALDISDRKQAELALQESQHLIQRIAEASPNILYIYDLLEERNIYVNQGISRILHYTPEQVRDMGNTLFPQLMHPEDLQRFIQHRPIFDTAKDSDIVEFEYRLKDSQGNWHWLVSRDIVFSRTAEGKPKQILGSASDITERKQVEERLRLSERAIAGSSNGIVMADARLPDMPIIFVNPAFEKVTGYSIEEVLGQNCRFLQKGDRRQPELDRLREAIRHRRSCTVILRNYRKDGSLFWNELNISPIFDDKGQLTHYLGIPNDITEFRKQELERRIVQKRLEYLLASSPGILYSMQADGQRATFVSHNCTALLGYSPQDIQAPGFWRKQLHPEDVESRFDAGMKQLFATGRHSTEYRFRHRDGRYRWIYDRMKLVRDDAGHPLEIIGYWLDITDRKQAEEALRASENRYRLMADNSTDAITRHSPDGVYLYASPACRTLLGYDPEDLIGRSAYEFFHPEDLRAIQQSHQNILNLPDVQTVTYRVRRHDGSYIWFETTSRTVRDDSGRVKEIVAVSRDVSARKQVEDSLKASLQEKEILLKEIHHRVKNNLLVVSSLLEFQSDYTDDPEVVKILQDSQTRIASMALIHEKLYRSTDLARIDFGEYLENLVESTIASYDVRERPIHVQLDIEPISLNIETAQPCSLIVSELLSNAFKHAFPDGREGTISLGLHAIEGERFRLTVSDDGVGVPENLDIRAVDSLGMELVCTLTQQLDVALQLDRRNGTFFALEFSELHYRKRV